MKNLFSNGLNNYTFFEEVSSSILKRGLIGERAISFLEKEMNSRLSALHVEFCYISRSCVSCTFITPSGRFCLSFAFHDDIFDFIINVMHVLIAYSLGKGYNVDF